MLFLKKISIGSMNTFFLGADIKKEETLFNVYD